MNIYSIDPDLRIYSNTTLSVFASKFESAYVIETLQLLKSINPDFYDGYSFYILFNNGIYVNSWECDRVGDRKSIFIIFDEYGRVPNELLAYPDCLVFHAYLSFDEKKRPYRNLFHFPLGCNSFVPDKPYVAPDRRKLNVFFSGNLHIGRKRFYQALSGLYNVPLTILGWIQRVLRVKFDGKFPSSHIRFTDGFGTGLSYDEYAQLLSESKIVISPPGITNVECFRHYEGLRAGCVVIAEKLPVKPQYIGSPIVVIENWSQGFKVIDELTKDKSRIETLCRQSYDWYHERLNSIATAKYILASVEYNLAQ